MNQNINQLYCEYRDELRDMVNQYADSSTSFDDNTELEQFFIKAEGLKTLVGLYADLARIRRKKLK